MINTVPIPRTIIYNVMNDSKYEQAMLTCFKAFGIRHFQREYLFHVEHCRQHNIPGARKWRFDFSFKTYEGNKVAIELEGGSKSVYSRHTSPVGFDKDCVKYNMATMLGWELYRIPTDWLIPVVKKNLIPGNIANIFNRYVVDKS